MSLYKFTHIPLLKNNALLKQTKKSDKKSNHSNLLGNKNHIQKKKSRLKKKTKKKKSQKKAKEKEKEKKQRIGQAHVHAYLLFTYQISPTQFSFYFGKKIFWWVRRKNTQTPPIFFPLPPTKHPPKKFSFSFFFSKKCINK